MRQLYSIEEKKAHVVRAYEFVANGGTFVEYIENIGISRSALSQWKTQFNKDGSLKGEKVSLIPVGKPVQQKLSLSLITIKYYGARSMKVT